ncbi:extensin family protein [Fuscovulum blasticum]|uniref:extensin-like domain-containing protein n=1 Tax=Fuscovulum blasticum TaxID=1075 RepID=UPI000D504A02|nr:extensin family protein [Fuscovulum blasticum]AWD22673.1 hypothetical protein B6K69_14155 [Fuscovulum blasticum]
MRAALAVVLTLLSAPLAAQTMDRSPRPVLNPVYATAAPAATPAAPPAAEEGTQAVIAASLRPAPRPGGLEQKVAAARKGQGDEGLDLLGLRPGGSAVETASAPAPELTPEPAPTGKKKRKKDRETVSKKGSVCGVAAIKGEKIAPIKAKVKGCGLADGVRVTSVSGVRLSQAATIDCDTARALNTWVDQVLQPSYGNSVVELKIAAHYICRPRNNKKGAKISEHGRGKAVDVAGFVLSNGKTLSVARNFDRTMRRAYKSACGIFGTTLGPGSDGYHEDHMHFDTASQRNGPYCR